MVRGCGFEDGAALSAALAAELAAHSVRQSAPYPSPMPQTVTAQAFKEDRVASAGAGGMQGAFVAAFSGKMRYVLALRCNHSICSLGRLACHASRQNQLVTLSAIYADAMQALVWSSCGRVGLR